MAQRIEWTGAIPWDAGGSRWNARSGLQGSEPTGPGIFKGSGSFPRHRAALGSCLAVFLRQPLGHSISETQSEVRRHRAAEKLLPRLEETNAVGRCDQREVAARGIQIGGGSESQRASQGCRRTFAELRSQRRAFGTGTAERAKG